MGRLVRLWAANPFRIAGSHGCFWSRKSSGRGEQRQRFAAAAMPQGNVPRTVDEAAACAGVAQVVNSQTFATSPVHRPKRRAHDMRFPTADRPCRLDRAASAARLAAKRFSPWGKHLGSHAF